MTVGVCRHPALPTPQPPYLAPLNPVIPAKAGFHTSAYRNAKPLPGFWIPAYAGMTVKNIGIPHCLPANAIPCTPQPRHSRPQPRHSRPQPRHSRESGNPHLIPPPCRAATGVLDSGLRQNDGGEYAANPVLPTPQPPYATTTIPAPHRHSCESVNPHPSLPPRRATTAGVLDSGLRRNDGGEYAAIRHYLSRNTIPRPAIAIPYPHSVIPAKAGIHTPPCRPAGPLPGFWIPACAGMTVGRRRRAASGSAYRGRGRRAIDD